MTLAFSLSISVHSEEAKTRLSIGYYSLPPHAVNISGKPDGAAIRFLQEKAFPDSRYHLGWTFFPFARLLEQLKAGEIDCGILIAKTKDRNELFQYPDAFLHQTRSGIVTLKGNPDAQFSDLRNIKGLRLGHVTDSVRPQQLIDAGVIFDDISGENNLERNIVKLQRKRIDGVFVPTVSHAQYQLRKKFDLNQLGIQELPMSGYKLYVVFRADIPDEILKDYNKVSHQDYATYLSTYTDTPAFKPQEP